MISEFSKKYSDIRRLFQFADFVDLLACWLDHFILLSRKYYFRVFVFEKSSISFDIID